MATINISPQKQPLPFSELEKELSHNRDLFYKPLVNAMDIALSSKKEGSQKVNRPLNSFMVYKINFNQVVKLYDYSWGKNMKHATRCASFLWKQATPQEKSIFVEIADQSRVFHKQLNPGYNYSHTVKRASNFVMVDFSKRKNSNKKLKESNPTCPTIDPTTPTTVDCNTVDDSINDSTIPAFQTIPLPPPSPLFSSLTSPLSIPSSSPEMCLPTTSTTTYSPNLNDLLIVYNNNSSYYNNNCNNNNYNNNDDNNNYYYNNNCNNNNYNNNDDNNSYNNNDDGNLIYYNGNYDYIYNNNYINDNYHSINNNNIVYPDAYDNVITYPCGDFNLDCNAYMKGDSNPLENPNCVEELCRLLLLQDGANKQI